MWIQFWIGLGIFYWVTGYTTVGRVDEQGFDFQKVFVRPPRALYILCGCPKTSKLPRGVMGLRSVACQLQGMVFGLYGVLYKLIGNRDFFLHTILIAFASILVYVYVDRLKKTNKFLLE